MAAAEDLTASLEDYLEAIYHIIAAKEGVRPKDIAERLKVGNSSVTGALRSLAEKELIRYAPYDVITLTPRGKAAAKDVVHRHEVLCDFLVNVLSVDKAEADAAACKMEHSIPKAILERLIQFAEFMEICPKVGAKWTAGFGYHCDSPTQENCEKCVALSLEEVRNRGSQGGGKRMPGATLRELKPGQKCKVVRIRARGETNKRIVEMGVTPGALVEVECVASVGDHIDVKVRGYHLSLRRQDAERIDVELV